jgi:hypothetical protein
MEEKGYPKMAWQARTREVTQMKTQTDLGRRFGRVEEMNGAQLKTRGGGMLSSPTCGRGSTM